MISDRIRSLLETCETDDAHFPPTDLYNEGWMLRLVLDWLYRSRLQNHRSVIPFSQNAKWYSEALLPSAFLPEERGDKLAESHTHADGVIGNFTVGSGAKGDLTLQKDARSLVVIEAKMFSKLSSGVTNARFYNQAARNVACIAHVLGKAGMQASDLEVIGFYVVAPESQIRLRLFSTEMAKEHIDMTVNQRVGAYAGRRDGWYNSCFLPLLKLINIDTISWERIISDINGLDAAYGTEIQSFYDKCLKFNNAVALSSRVFP